MTAPAAPATDFDRVAAIYDNVFAAHIREHYLARRTAYLLDALSQSAAWGAGRATALDVGAGTGLLAERLHDRGVAVTALDPFAEMLEQLLRRQPAIVTAVASGQSLPYQDDSFDMVYTVAVLHHIADAELVRQTLAEMVRVTRPEGRIVVWDHNPLNPYWPHLMRRVPQDSGAERLVPLAELVTGLREAGATVLRAERRGLVPEFVPRRWMGLAASLERGIEAIPGLRRFCAHNVVVATKG